MAYTPHGHHIPGTAEHPHTIPVARCGGITICGVCKVHATNMYIYEIPTAKKEDNMQIDTSTYIRKPFEVEGIQVTEANMTHVAKWCKGEIITDKGSKHILVDVQHPLNERQKKAYVGDWVLFSSTRFFKVYTQKAFEKNFDREEEPVLPKDELDAPVAEDASALSTDAEAVAKVADRTDEDELEEAMTR